MKKIILMILLAVVSVACSKIACVSYDADGCPAPCVVCPPCAVCSSISCQTEEFCKSIGFDKNWYAGTKFICSPEQRTASTCPEIYQPVCAKVDIRCITVPCNPIQETYPNACEACKNDLVESYSMGECDEKK